MYRRGNRYPGVIEQPARDSQDIRARALNRKVRNRASIGLPVTPRVLIKDARSAIVETPSQHGFGVSLLDEIVRGSFLPAIENAVPALKLSEKAPSEKIDGLT